MQHRALIIGNSDGIGLAASKALLDKKWKVIGISRRPSPVNHPDYTHKVLNLNDDDYAEQLDSAVRSQEPLDVCIFCAGIGEMLDTKQMEKEIEIINVNFLGMVKTAATIIPAMVAQGKGHFIGLSSVADEMLSAEAPSYHASKAGFSNYIESLALALRPSGVSITNVRFGFVDTKMAKGDVKPFMMSVDRAVQHLLTCLDKKPARYTAPGIVIPLVSLRRWLLKLKLKFGR